MSRADTGLVDLVPSASIMAGAMLLLVGASTLLLLTPLPSYLPSDKPPSDRWSICKPPPPLPPPPPPVAVAVVDVGGGGGAPGWSGV